MIVIKSNDTLVVLKPEDRELIVEALGVEEGVLRGKLYLSMTQHEKIERLSALRQSLEESIQEEQ